jgi:hypothetical protein
MEDSNAGTLWNALREITKNTGGDKTRLSFYNKKTREKFTATLQLDVDEDEEFDDVEEKK